MQYLKNDGLTDYELAVQFMENQVAEINLKTAQELVWFVEHPPLYTAGTSANASDLLDSGGFPVFQTGRGGQYTYHGPGQQVVYVMLDLKQRNAMDVKLYVRNLEQWLINSLAVFGVEGQRRSGRVGIWVVLNDKSEAKIAAIGIRVRKWVTYHGVALNICPDLSHFDGIIPCGISQYGVTSLEKLGIRITKEEVQQVLEKEFGNIFGLSSHNISSL